MKKVLITGGAGFVGTNLIKRLKSDYPQVEITSLDNYFTGDPANHQPGVTYYRGNTWDAPKIFENKTFDTVFHFGEYSRIVQSFTDIEYTALSILTGTPRILELCRKWKANLIYSASSSKFGNDGADENLAPYSWMKAKMVELIKNYGDWYGLQYQINYFFNVYGPHQITKGDYATVVGIFERQYRAGEKCTVVKPGTQTRNFTHIDDIINGVIKSTEYLENATSNQIERECFLHSGVDRTIIEVAEMFGEWEFIDARKGEREHSTRIDNGTNERLGLNPQDRLYEWIKNIKNESTR